MQMSLSLLLRTEHLCPARLPKTVSMRKNKIFSNDGENVKKKIRREKKIEKKGRERETERGTSRMNKSMI